MTVLCIVLAALAVFLLILAVNTFSALKKAPKLKSAEPMYTEDKIKSYAQRLSKMIQCKTVSVHGSFDDTEFKKLRETVRELFPLVHEKAEKMTFSDDCWIYKIPGRDSERNIMLMSHHDVVKVSSEWKYGRFSGELAEGKLWGRGMVDTKTPLFAEFSALEELLAEGFELPCNVYIGSFHNEKFCGDGIPKANEYFKANGISFEVILDEGGAIIEAPLGGMKCDKCSMLAVHEKGRYYLSCTAFAGNYHPSLTAATRLSPVESVSAFINDVMTKDIFIRRLNPEVTAMFKHLGSYCGFPMNVLFANLGIFGPVLKKVMPKVNPQAGGLIGTTCTSTKIEGSNADRFCTVTAFAPR